MMRSSVGAPARQYAVAAVCVVLLSGALYAFVPPVPYQSVSLLLLFAVALLSLTLDVGPVVAAATLSALIWNFFFIPPHFTLVIGQTTDIILFLTYFVIASITGVLTTRVREREHRAGELYRLTRELVEAASLDAVAAAAVRNIDRTFGVRTAVYLSSIDGEVFTMPHPSSTLVTNGRDDTVAAWVYWNERKAGRAVDILPSVRPTFYPVSGPRYPLGVVGIDTGPRERLDAATEPLLQNFIGQIASALEREQLNELTRRTAVFAESEKLYRTLFSSISHELRTPVAAIVTAAESLTGGNVTDIGGEIRIAAERLHRLVENLLDITRLESGRLAPALDWCDAGDLLRSAVLKARTVLGDRAVTTDVPPDMPLVKLDFVLMEQAFINLLVNAALYAPPQAAVSLTARMEGERCVFTVADDGPGFPDSALPHLFEKFYRIPGSRAGGTGLGLSIVKRVVEEHGGVASASNRPEGGACVSVRLPAPHQPLHAAGGVRA